MEFFGMGTGEILLIIIVALIIWGPGKLPEIARTVGKAMSALKQTSSDITAQITKELNEAEEEKKDHLPPPIIKSQTNEVKPLASNPNEVKQQASNTPENITGED